MAYLDNSPIVTIKTARRLLGKQAEGLDDVEVMEIVRTMHEAAKKYLKKRSVKKPRNRLGSDNGLSGSKPR